MPQILLQAMLLFRKIELMLQYCFLDTFPVVMTSYFPMLAVEYLLVDEYKNFLFLSLINK